MARTYTRRYTSKYNGRTYTFTSKYTSYDSYSYPTSYNSNNYYSSDDPTFIIMGVVLGLFALGFIIAVIVYFLRQKRRKAWYSQMAAHYHNGGSPPWATATGGVGDGAVKVQSNDSPSQSPYPKAQYGDPTQFGVYGNLPTAPYSSATNVTGYPGADFHSATPTPVTPSLSPQPRHSQYSTTTASFEPYNANPSVRHSIVYARSVATPTPSVPAPDTYGAPSFYGGALSNAAVYNSPPNRPGYTEANGPAQGPVYSGGPHRGPEHVEASGSAQALAYSGGLYSAYDAPPKGPEYAEANGSAQAPAYFGGPYSTNDFPVKGPEYAEAPAYSGGPYGANEYPRGKDQGYTIPSAGKQ